jgi:hypothetical protein
VLVFDKGYNSYQWNELTDKGLIWVTRIRVFVTMPCYRALESRSTGKNSAVNSDQTLMNTQASNPIKRYRAQHVV